MADRAALDEHLNLLPDYETWSGIFKLNLSFTMILNPYNPIYISYAWNDNDHPYIANIVQTIQQIFIENHISYKLDKIDMNNGDSIREFEEEIGNGSIVIILVSEKFLKSSHCIYEWNCILFFHLFNKLKDYNDVILIRHNDVDYKNESFRERIYNFWNEQNKSFYSNSINALFCLLENHTHLKVNTFDEIKFIQSIKKEISKKNISNLHYNSKIKLTIDDIDNWCMTNKDLIEKEYNLCKDSKYIISDEMHKKDPGLVCLISNSKSLSTPLDKQKWFDLYKKMDKSQIYNLYRILIAERYKLQSIETKTNNKLHEILGSNNLQDIISQCNDLLKYKEKPTKLDIVRKNNSYKTELAVILDCLREKYEIPFKIAIAEPLLVGIICTKFVDTIKVNELLHKLDDKINDSNIIYETYCLFWDSPILNFLETL